MSTDLKAAYSPLDEWKAWGMNARPEPTDPPPPNSCSLSSHVRAAARCTVHMRLYDYAASGNCFKVRLLLALLGRDYERVRSTSSPATR